MIQISRNILGQYLVSLIYFRNLYGFYLIGKKIIKKKQYSQMGYMQCISYLDFIIIPFLSSGFVVVVRSWLLGLGFVDFPRLGRSSFHKAIFFGRTLYLTVKFGLSPMYSPRSVVYWGQCVPKGVGLLGFLKSHMGKYGLYSTMMEMHL